MPKRTAKSCLPSRDATVWAKRWAHLAALELPEYEVRLNATRVYGLRRVSDAITIFF